MILDITSYALAVIAPANLVIVTRNGAVSDMMETLKDSGYNLILVKPEKDKERVPYNKSALTKHAHIFMHYFWNYCNFALL
jgi:hypothetical protein